jgi:hypothetical protein
MSTRRLFRNIFVWTALTMALCPLSASGQAEPSDAAYAVYSAYLRIQLDGKHGIEGLRLGEGGSVISPVIRPMKLPRDARGQLEIRSRIPEAESDTLESLSSCSTSSYRLLPKLSLPVEYRLISPKLVPARSSYIEFSCVGTNTAGTEAVLFASRMRCECAVGLLVLMRRSKDGNWTISKEVVDWIA